MGKGRARGREGSFCFAPKETLGDEGEVDAF